MWHENSTPFCMELQFTMHFIYIFHLTIHVQQFFVVPAKQ